jgi:MarR family transcriptional regulator, organic hydroperoxide resistance regulator
MQHAIGNEMCDKNTPANLNEFLGAIHMFAAAMHIALEEDLLKASSDYTLTFSQLKLLKLVSLSNSFTMGDAAEFMQVSKAAASKAVDKLAKKSLLVRSPGETDRRKTCLSLTDQGRLLLSRYEEGRERKLRDLFSSAIPAELHRVSALLDCLSARIAIENLNAQPGKLCLQCGTYFRKNCLLKTQLGRQCIHTRKQEPGARSKPGVGQNPS